jgi:hypothetical protein
LPVGRVSAQSGERYIVTLRDDVDDPKGLARRFSRDEGFALTHVF